MKYKYLGQIDYDGSQLRHAFAYEKQKILGPSIVYFEGKAEVKEHLVDLEDSVNNDFIKSEKMMHFIIEIPDASIREMVVWQRFFMRMIVDKLRIICANSKVFIDGDDIMVDEKKLSVSIATLSHFSGLVHAGLNIEVGKGCPIAAIGLREIVPSYVSIPKFGAEIVQDFAKEYDDIVRASYKVQGV